MKLKHDKLLSNVAFNFNLRHYIKWALAAGTAVGVGIAATGPLLPAVFTNDAATAAAAQGPLQLVVGRCRLTPGFCS